MNACSCLLQTWHQNVMRQHLNAMRVTYYIYYITAATSSNYCTLLQCKRLCQVITCELSEKKLREFAVPRSGKLLEFGVDGARKVGCLAFVADDQTRWIFHAYMIPVEIDAAHALRCFIAFHCRLHCSRGHNENSIHALSAEMCQRKIRQGIWTAMGCVLTGRVRNQRCAGRVLQRWLGETGRNWSPTSSVRPQWVNESPATSESVTLHSLTGGEGSLPWGVPRGP